jgi:hypothetical protein
MYVFDNSGLVARARVQVMSSVQHQMDLPVLKSTVALPLFESTLVVLKLPDSPPALPPLLTPRDTLVLHLVRAWCGSVGEWVEDGRSAPWAAEEAEGGGRAVGVECPLARLGLR